jgi:hypothetical protein
MVVLVVKVETTQVALVVPEVMVLHFPSTTQRHPLTLYIYM